MSEYVTVQKNDPQMEKLIWGTFSQTQKALPYKSQNVGLSDQLVTFKIVSISDIEKTSFFAKLNATFKLYYLFILIVPWLYVLFKNLDDDRLFDPLSFALATAGSLCVFFAMALWNDVRDHISGYDRLNSSFRNKPLIKGWYRAIDLQKASYLFLGLGFVFSIPVMIRQPEEAMVIAVLLVLFLLGQFFKKNSYKNQTWGEILFFIIIGPGVVSGYQVAMGSGIDTECLVFGVFWAWAIQLIVHLNNYYHILMSSQSQIKNTMTRLGFDRGLKFLLFWYLGLLGLWVLYHNYYASTYWSWFSTLALVFWSIPTFVKMSRVQSPVGSDIKKMIRSVSLSLTIISTLFIAEFVWYYLFL